MPKEIERKFLVKDDSWRALAGEGKAYRQGYLSLDKERIVRVRVVGEMAVITIKGARHGNTALEYEYPLPLFDAEEMLQNLCVPPLIEKVRYEVMHSGLKWEVDVFSGENAGLIVAEVELEDAGQHVELPPWAGDEVSDDRRYANASLVLHPYSKWQ
ncbi:CYTH domain-containing protein [Geomonas sp. RF6]|uniref:CYTH domain-containing protein n=1 Tax=Geomonas sp. RF6 TaxID=2897342 RepID=UPI001E30A349|nr:CYTH domain-containing protein [Geomonas sp. RF6]UFS69839.1 CYTH domain-containing protein [Geomonas sp. RF6]